MTENEKQIESLFKDPRQETGALIDISLIEYRLTLSVDERLKANDRGLELMRELQRAGQEYYARESKSHT